MANRTPATATARPLAMCTLAVALLSACASAGPNASSQPSSGGSAAPASLGPAPSPGGASHPSGTPSGGCVTDAEHLTVQPGETPQPICLRAGDTLRIDTPASPRQPWQPFTTSDAHVISCTTTQGQDGTATATCHALHPGDASISTMTPPFPGDPHGPMQYQWQLAVRVYD